MLGRPGRSPGGRGGGGGGGSGDRASAAPPTLSVMPAPRVSPLQHIRTLLGIAPNSEIPVEIQQNMHLREIDADLDRLALEKNRIVAEVTERMKQGLKPSALQMNRLQTNSFQVNQNQQLMAAILNLQATLTTKRRERDVMVTMQRATNELRTLVDELNSDHHPGEVAEDYADSIAESAEGSVEMNNAFVSTHANSPFANATLNVGEDGATYSVGDETEQLLAQISRQLQSESDAEALNTRDILPTTPSVPVGWAPAPAGWTSAPTSTAPVSVPAADWFS